MLAFILLLQNGTRQLVIRFPSRHSSHGDSSGVRRSSSFSSTEAPDLSSATTSTWPFLATSCSGVEPRGSSHERTPWLSSWVERDHIGILLDTSAWNCADLPESPSEDDFAKNCSLEAVPRFSLPAELSPEDDLSVSGPR